MKSCLQCVDFVFRVMNRRKICIVCLIFGFTRVFRNAYGFNFLLANIIEPYLATVPSRLLALLDRILFFSLANKSTSCRVCARGVNVSNPDGAGWMFVEIGGGETGLDVIVYVISVQEI